jgi:hypothetical protein
MHHTRQKQKQKRKMNIAAIDIGTRNFAYCLLRFDYDKFNCNKRQHHVDCSKRYTMTEIPPFHVGEWATCDLGPNQGGSLEYAKRLVRLFSMEAPRRVIDQADVIVLETQIPLTSAAISNSTMFVLMVALYMYFTALGKMVEVKQSSVKFTLFKKLGVDLPGNPKLQTKRNEKWKTNKENSVFITKTVFGHIMSERYKEFEEKKLIEPMKEACSFIQNQKNHKERDLADCFNLALTYFCKEIRRIRFPQKRKRKEEDEEEEEQQDDDENEVEVD